MGRGDLWGAFVASGSQLAAGRVEGPRRWRQVLLRGRGATGGRTLRDHFAGRLRQFPRIDGYGRAQANGLQEVACALVAKDGISPAAAIIAR